MNQIINQQNKIKRNIYFTIFRDSQQFMWLLTLNTFGDSYQLINQFINFKFLLINKLIIIYQTYQRDNQKNYQESNTLLIYLFDIYKQRVSEINFLDCKKRAQIFI
ncbi:hypothetical protein ABPG72_008593 [Tetrahymena utriculariae]